MYRGAGVRIRLGRRRPDSRFSHTTCARKEFRSLDTVLTCVPPKGGDTPDSPPYSNAHEGRRKQIVSTQGAQFVLPPYAD